jgi:hypothetical protein
MADILSDIIGSYLGNKYPDMFGDPRTNQLLKEAHYSYIQDRLTKGESLKDQAYNPKALEAEFGPERAAPLIGYESTDSFKFAQQQRQAAQQEQQFLTGLKSAAESYLGAPVSDMQTVPGITPEEAQGFYPKLGMAGGELPQQEATSTANITQRAPSYPELESRLHQYPALRALTQGPEAVTAVTQGEAAQRAVEQGQRAQTRLESVEIPQAEATTTNAATNAAQEKRLRYDAALQRIQKNRENLAARQQYEGARLDLTHPNFTPQERLQVSKFFATNGRHALPPHLLNQPGIGRPVAGQVTPLATRNRVNAVLDTIGKYPQTVAKQKILPNQEQLDSQNAIHLSSLTRAQIEDARSGGLGANEVMNSILNSMVFYTRSGGRVIGQSYKDLDATQQAARHAQVERAIMDTLPSVGGDESASLVPRLTTGGAAIPQAGAEAAPATAAATAEPTIPHDPAAQLQLLQQEAARVAGGESPGPLDETLVSLSGSGVPEVRTAAQAYQKAKLAGARLRIKRPPNAR